MLSPQDRAAEPFQEALADIIRGSEPETMFQIGRTYPTREPICKRDGLIFQHGTVIGQVNDHMQRLWLVVRYSDGRTGQLMPNGRTGLGYPHACDLVLDQVVSE